MQRTITIIVSSLSAIACGVYSEPEPPVSVDCGDGLLSPDEECDDGNVVDGDGCSASCTLEGDATCGDGLLQEDEQCDDGNGVDGDGCSAACTPEAGFGCFVPGEPCLPTTAVD